MIRAGIVIMGLVFMAACSQFGNHPTSTPPQPTVIAPVASTLTPAIDFTNLWWDCHIHYRQEELHLSLQWNAEAYDGDFFLPREMAWDRLEEPPKPFNVHCQPMDRSTDAVWDRVEHGRFYFDCTLSLSATKGITSFRMRGPVRDSWYITSSVYLPLDVAWGQANQRGLFQMQVACGLTPVYPEV